MEKIKVFISQPMKGFTDDEIKAKRKELISKFLSVSTVRGKDIIFIDSFFEGAPHDAKPAWFLGESIKKLSEADLAIFADGWQLARGCQVEELVCRLYGIPMRDEAYFDWLRDKDKFHV